MTAQPSTHFHVCLRISSSAACLANCWRAGKIEPIMIKPRFSIWKKTRRMAAATLAFGLYENRSTGESMHPQVGVVDPRNLVERTLDPDSSLVSRCLRGEETAW